MCINYMTNKEICNKWALFKIGDTVINLKNIKTDKNVLEVGTKLIVDKVISSLKNKATLSRMKNYEIRNQWNRVFSYQVHDKYGNVFTIDEYALINENIDEKERNKAVKRTKEQDIIENLDAFSMLAAICFFILFLVFDFCFKNFGFYFDLFADIVLLLGTVLLLSSFVYMKIYPIAYKPKICQKGKQK